MFEYYQMINLLSASLKYSTETLDFVEKCEKYIVENKGKRKFVTVVSDINKSPLSEVINSHKSDEIIKALKYQPEAVV